MGLSGSVTGDGAVRVLPIKLDGTTDTPVDLTPLSVTASVRINATFSGDTYQAVRVYITNDGGDAGTVTIAGLVAQIQKPGDTYTAPTVHIKGEGICGMMFIDAQMPFVQNRLDNLHMETSATLKEVEWWL